MHGSLDSANLQERLYTQIVYNINFDSPLTHPGDSYYFYLDCKSNLIITFSWEYLALYTDLQLA